MGRDLRAQALAKQSATLRTIKEKPHEIRGELPSRRKSVEYNGRPSIMLGADVSRAMRWAEGGFDMERQRSEKPVPEKPKVVEKKVEPRVVAEIKVEKVVEKPQEQIKSPLPSKVPTYQGPAVTKLPDTDAMQEIPREPTSAPKVQVARSKTPEPNVIQRSRTPEPKFQIPRSKTPEPGYGPILLDPSTSYTGNKLPENKKSPPSKLKKLFGGGKSKEEKRMSRAMSPIPPDSSPTPVITQPSNSNATNKFLNAPIPAVEQRARSPVQEWEEDFDGTHRHDLPTTKPESYKSKSTPQTSEIHLPIKPSAVAEDYRPATPPSIPIARSETPTSVKTSEDEELDRWAQIRKAAGQRALNRNVAPPRTNKSVEDVTEVNIPRIRQNTNSSTASTSPPRRKGLKAEEDKEEEESVDARVARIRKRVQELTAGMSDD